MKVKVSRKYQIVIPKAARQKMMLPKHGSYMFVKKVTSTEITYAVTTTPTTDIERFAGILKEDLGKNPVTKLRIIRNEEWDKS